MTYVADVFVISVICRVGQNILSWVYILTKPVYIVSARIKSDEGIMACDKVREKDAMLRKTIDIVNVIVNPNKKKMKKGPTSLRRFVMKYRARLKVIAVVILHGRSHTIDAKASALGW